MRGLRHLVGAVMCLMLAKSCGQNLNDANRLWHLTVSAVQSGDEDSASEDFAAFDSAARDYVRAHGRDWQIEYLVGSLECLFPDKRSIGAEFLEDLLQNSQTLNGDGKVAVRKQLDACQSGMKAVTLAAQLTLPQNMADTYMHFQFPGVSGSMKGGGRAPKESIAVSSIATETLLARRVALDAPRKALQQGLANLPAGAAGDIVGPFAVVTASGTPADALAIGKCLESYRAVLSKEFQIDSPQYMITAYAVPDVSQVYELAGRLHGLNLPYGVIAYSVRDDMSLVAPANAGSCGSMAHELVHLLIKQRFPDAPAWLEEGLASEVAIASPAKDRLRFAWSWRDDTLEGDLALRPNVVQLLELPWSAFNSDQLSEVRKARAVQAMAAVFIRYLDAKGKLSDVYFEVRDKHVSADLGRFKSYEAILEGDLGKPVSAVDADFAQWFAAEFRTSSAASVQSQQGSSSGNDNVTPQSSCTPMSPQMQQSPACPQPAVSPNTAPRPRN